MLEQCFNVITTLVDFAVRGCSKCSCTCWRSLPCGAAQNSSGKECPHWSTFSKHKVIVSTGDPTEPQFSRSEMDPPSTHTLSARPRKDGCSAPWKSTSHVPVWAKPDVSFCYIKIRLTDKKANVHADKREASREDALSSEWSFFSQCQGHFQTEVFVVAKYTT